MFGYIKIEKDELKVKDYNLFKAYYCGLCQCIKKKYGFPARYFLSYDATFLAVLLSALSEEENQSRPIRCMANPAVLRPALCENEAVCYAAAVNILLVWFKLKDDVHDEHSLKAALFMPLMYRKRKKAQKQYPELYEKMEAALSALSELEQKKTPEADVVAGAFGTLMADIFDTPIAGSDENRRIVSHIGLLLGRFIYLLDAWEDKAEDEKKKSYNPFLLSSAPDAEDMKLSLNYTLSEIANSMQLLSLTKNHAVIENILYLGLKKSLDGVFSEKPVSKDDTKEIRHERPL